MWTTVDSILCKLFPDVLHMLDLINCGEQVLANIERGADEKVTAVEGYRPVSV